MTDLYIGNNMMIGLLGDGALKNWKGESISGATVEATLYKSDLKTQVSGFSWPIKLSEGDRDGEYWGILPRDLDIVSGVSYVISVVAKKDNSRSEWNKTIIAGHRSFKDSL